MSEEGKSMDVSVIVALKTKENTLAAELAAILEERNAEIQAAKDKYAEALKEIKAKQVALKRMIKTSEKL